MLDTTIVSHAVRQHPAVLRHMDRVPVESVCVSAITAGEITFGLARHARTHRLHIAMNELLGRVDVLPWSRQVASAYGPLRAELERTGRVLGPLDLLIAANARALGAVLVTNDQAMLRLTNLETEDWTRDV
jgi:tRNA(fMet)-specific endonuclease VapC